jgi:cbb3-type cytochrome oxidase subunit 3
MMRQVMEGAGLTLWPILSLLIFTLSSAAMIAWMFRPGSKNFYGRLSRMALGNTEDTYEGGQEEKRS